MSSGGEYELREHDTETPAILLGKREQLPQLIKALDTGADDFLTLPFPMAEMAARLKAVLRRSHSQRTPTIAAGLLVLDQSQRKIHEHGQELTLTAKEFALLELLAHPPRRVRGLSRRAGGGCLVRHPGRHAFSPAGKSHLPATKKARRSKHHPGPCGKGV